MRNLSSGPAGFDTSRDGLLSGAGGTLGHQAEICETCASKSGEAPLQRYPWRTYGRGPAAQHRAGSPSTLAQRTKGFPFFGSQAQAFSRLVAGGELIGVLVFFLWGAADGGHPARARGYVRGMVPRTPHQLGLAPS